MLPRETFSLPIDAIGRFAIVKLWPDLLTAEDECIARIKIAANSLGIECFEINPDGGSRFDPSEYVSKKNVDFVIHLHYDTPKRYDAFSFVALWNPTAFLHEWGYSRCSRNLISHDDFLSCSSPDADDHIARLVRTKATHLPAAFNLYHSTPDIIHPPSLGDLKLFYAGINWEVLGRGKSRHQDLLKQLDKTGALRIYGPKIFMGVDVWKGYNSYVKEVPFDGISMLDEISKAGVSLVLSSQAHKDSELMSNRLFESVAAGALVICDENPFAKKFFADTVLYIDGRQSPQKMQDDILRHLDWISAHQDEALDMIKRSQDIFVAQFSLSKNIKDLYQGLAARKAELLCRQNPSTRPSLGMNVYFLLPKFSADVLDAHIRSINIQEYLNFSPILVVDENDYEKYRTEIENAVAASRIAISIERVRFFEDSAPKELEPQPKRRLGLIIQSLVDLADDAASMVVVAPNERLFSNHLSVLAGALQRDETVNCVATAAILLDGTTPVHSVHELIDFGGINPAGPPGYGRFAFRISGIPKDIALALPYLDSRPLAVLVGNNEISQQLPATISIDVASTFNFTTAGEVRENAIIFDFSPAAFNIAHGFQVYRPSEMPGHTQQVSYMSLRWIVGQMQAIRRSGLKSRLRVLRRKLVKRAN